MHNPLALLDLEALNSFIAAGFTIFLRQSYHRGKDHSDTGVKEVFLITPYKDIGLANQHFQNIRFDNRKYIYQIHRPEEVEKLKTAASQPPGYKIYVDKLATLKWKVSDQMSKKVSNYLRNNTKWKAGDGGINANLFLQYGELMISLSNGAEEIKIKLSEIEGL